MTSLVPRQDVTVPWRPELTVLWLALPLLALFGYRVARDYLFFGPSGPVISIALAVMLFVLVPLIINLIEWLDVKRFEEANPHILTFTSPLTESLREALPRAIKSGYVQVAVDEAGIRIYEFGKKGEPDLFIACSIIEGARLGPSTRPIRPSVYLDRASGGEVVFQPLLSTKFRTTRIWGNRGITFIERFRESLTSSN